MAFGDNTSTVKLAADVGSFVRDIKTAEGQVKAFDKGLGTLKTAALGMATALVSAAGIGGIGAMVRSSMELQDTLAKTADRLGITTKALAAFHLQANLSGVGADGFDTSIQKMSNNLQDAANGIGTAKDAVKALGLDIYDLASKSPQEAFLQIAEAMKGVGSATQKLSITTDIFGERGRDVVNMLAEGREGFDAAAQKVEFFGTALSRVDAAKIEAANDAMTLAKESADGLATRISLRLSPILAEMADNFARNSVELAKFLGFRTEQEELNHLLEERAAKLQKIADIEAATGGRTEGTNMLRAETDALRQQINVILDKQKAEAAAFIETDKTRIAEEAATKTRLQNAAAEKQAADDKKAAIAAELQAMRDMDAERKEIAESWLAYQTENAIAEQALMDQRVSGLVDYQDNLRQITAIQIEEGARQVEAERWASDQIRNMKMDVWAQAAGLLRALGPEHKNAARAAIVIEKALAIASIKINTEVAAMRALAELGPVAGTAAASEIRFMGGVSMGLVAATGIAELSNLNSSGASSVGNAAAAPSPTPYSNHNGVLPGQTQASGSITINVNGVITDEIVQGLIVPAIQDAVENRDVVLIRNDSRNGQQLAA